MGVHTNACVLGRRYGIRQLLSLEKRPVLCRDLTDAFDKDPLGHHWARNRPSRTSNDAGVPASRAINWLAERLSVLRRTGTGLGAFLSHHGLMPSEQESAAVSNGQLAATDIADWDRVADVYAASIGGPEDRIYAMLRDGLWSSLGPDVSGLDILDLGCGHGWLSALLAAKGARVRGIDGSMAYRGSRTPLLHVRYILAAASFLLLATGCDAVKAPRAHALGAAQQPSPATTSLPWLTPKATTSQRSAPTSHLSTRRRNAALQIRCSTPSKRQRCATSPGGCERSSAPSRSRASPTRAPAT